MASAQFETRTPTPLRGSLKRCARTCLPRPTSGARGQLVRSARKTAVASEATFHRTHPAIRSKIADVNDVEPRAPRMVVPWPLVGLIACVLVAYVPSFSAGFLNYDDPWLFSN